MDITTLSQLTKYTEGQVVQLPDFAEGQPFVARIRRPSLLALAKAGKIPNSLLHTANNMFLGTSNNKDPKFLQDAFGVLDVVCEACFLEPTYAEIQEAGIELTDDQYMFIFNYTQTGVKALDSFRGKSRDSALVGNGETV